VVLTKVRSEVASGSNHAAALKSVSGLVSNSIVTNRTANQHINHTAIVRASSAKPGVNFVLFSVLSLPLRLELCDDPSTGASQCQFLHHSEVRGRRPPWWTTCSHLHSTQVVSCLPSPILAMLLISRSHPLFRSSGVGQRAVINSPIKAISPISSCAQEHGNRMT
jgi:hypothetical protein